jgi:hypothetical protein
MLFDNFKISLNKMIKTEKELACVCKKGWWNFDSLRLYLYVTGLFFIFYSRFFMGPIFIHAILHGADLHAILYGADLYSCDSSLRFFMGPIFIDYYTVFTRHSSRGNRLHLHFGAHGGNVWKPGCSQHESGIIAAHGGFRHLRMARSAWRMRDGMREGCATVRHFFTSDRDGSRRSEMCVLRMPSSSSRAHGWSVSATSGGVK